MNSISHWIQALKAGDAEAARHLWNRFSSRLVEIARHKLGKSSKQAADEEDLAQSVFLSLCRGASAGRFNDITTRDELWWLLLVITRQKVIDHVRRESAEKRGGGRVYAEAAFVGSDGEAFSLDHLIGQEPTPEYVTLLAEEHQRLMGLLRDDRMRLIAASRIEGYTVQEIADDLSISKRSVERKLRLIRNAWMEDLNRGG